MPTQKKDRQWVSTRARAAAIEAARRRKMRKRMIAAVAAGVLVIALLSTTALLATRDSGSSLAASTTTSFVSTTTVPLESAAGKPCVAVSEPLPAGAPEVPVQVGPPPTALVTQDLKVGDGPEVTLTQTVTANYTAIACSTGKIFDSSYTRGQPSQFPLSNVIKGWQQGIPGMKVGGLRLLGIPPALGYGDNPPPDIAPGETLWFLIDVVSAS